MSHQRLTLSAYKIIGAIGEGSREILYSHSADKDKASAIIGLECR